MSEVDTLSTDSVSTGTMLAGNAASTLAISSAISKLNVIDSRALSILAHSYSRATYIYECKLGDDPGDSPTKVVVPDNCSLPSPRTIIAGS